MRCSTCQGMGSVIKLWYEYGGYALEGASPRSSPSTEPCPDCNGCGLMHCCDGLQANEAKDE